MWVFFILMIDSLQNAIEFSLLEIPMLLSINSFWLIWFPMDYLLGLTNVLVDNLGAVVFLIGLLTCLTILAILLTIRLYFQIKKQ